ncbi:MAG: MATE family efflux transporter, partial [Clostridia bacterium]|nr:MATE family efflux transporter [Clostridia bacterium]
MLLVKRNEMDMTTGPLMKKLVAYAVPVVISGILQLLFNAADVIIVGRYAGRTALAAVGSTTSLINLIVNLFMMTSIGVNVAVARYYGAHEPVEVSKTVSTAMTMSVIIGLFVGVFGIAASRPMLMLMESPADVLDQAALYLRIYFMGIPALMVYNFGAAVLRAVGDTQRPMKFLTIAGIINIILNLITVIYFKMGVAGVAIATAVSQYVSAAFIVMSLVTTESCLHLEVKEMRIYKDKLAEILRIGLPAGLQSLLFSITNVMIQSSVNTFGSTIMAGSSAASNIDGFIYTSMNAVTQTAMAFTGQNMGAKKYERIGSILKRCILLVTLVGGTMGVVCSLFRNGLINIYANGDPEVIYWGAQRMLIVALPYFIFGISDTIVGVVRGMGNSTLPMIISIFGVCAFR